MELEGKKATGQPEGFLMLFPQSIGSELKSHETFPSQLNAKILNACFL